MQDSAGMPRTVQIFADICTALTCVRALRDRQSSEQWNKGHEHMIMIKFLPLTFKGPYRLFFLDNRRMAMEWTHCMIELIYKNMKKIKKVTSHNQTFKNKTNFCRLSSCGLLDFAVGDCCCFLVVGCWLSEYVFVQFFPLSVPSLGHYHHKEIFCLIGFDV
jgi:hypothetical protein